MSAESVRGAPPGLGRGKARYVAIEGVDGCGKTSSVPLLAARAFSRESVITVKEPSRGRIGALVKELWQSDVSVDPRSLALLFAADTLDSQTRPGGVRALLAEQKSVLSDRCLLSTYVYLAHDCGIRWLDELHRDCLFPDLVFLIDVNPRTALDRLQSRGGMGIRETEEELCRVRDEYLRFATIFAERDCQIRVVPSDGLSLAEVVAWMAEKISSEVSSQNIEAMIHP